MPCRQVPDRSPCRTAGFRRPSPPCCRRRVRTETTSPLSPFVLEPVAQCLRAVRRCGSTSSLVASRVDRCAQAEIQYVARQHHGVEHVADDTEQVVRAGGAGRGIVDPVAVQVIVRIAGLARFVDFPVAMRCLLAFIGVPLSAARASGRRAGCRAGFPAKGMHRTRHRTCRRPVTASGSSSRSVAAERDPCRFPARSGVRSASASASPPPVAVPTIATVSPRLDLHGHAFEQRRAAVVD